MDTGLELTLVPVKTEAAPTPDKSNRDIHAVASTLVDLPGIPGTPDTAKTTRGLSSGYREEFIVLDNSEDPS